jgi:predicted nucleotidyltransferase component of viral defense system
MLSRHELGKYGPPGFHLAQKEKDYVQHWLLYFLSRSGFGGVFKGGTCLQKAFGLPRFSEDLDFSLGGAGEPDYESASAFLSSAGFSGLGWEKRSGDASISARLRFRGPLYNGSGLSEGTVTLEFSQRERIICEPKTVMITPPYPDILPYQVRAMEQEEMAAEKIRALATRASARDLFDLYFLLHQNTGLRRKLVDEKLAFYKLRFEETGLEDKIGKLRSIWEKEMGALTPSPLGYESVAKHVAEEVRKQLGS